MTIVDSMKSSRDVAQYHDREDGREREKDDVRHQHRSDSSACTKRLMARRSAEPPGLSRRWTNASCTVRARTRQSGWLTPPRSRKDRAALCAKQRPVVPPRCSSVLNGGDQGKAGLDSNCLCVRGDHVG